MERVWPSGERAKPRPGSFMCHCGSARIGAHWHPNWDHVAEAWSRPGIYVLIDGQDRQPRYVGQTKNLRTRLNIWFRYTRRALPSTLPDPVRTVRWLASASRSPLVWTPWLPTSGWSKEQRRTEAGTLTRRWDITVEPWLATELLRAEARAIACLREQGAPLLNPQPNGLLLAASPES
jgi:hypothetical protein